MSEKLVDIAGHTIEPGDTVVYPQQSGRSVQMVLGTLLSYNGKTAQIQRQEGSRWDSSYQRTRYRDKRTGKGIDPWTADWRHWDVIPGYDYTHKVTGEVIDEQEFERRFPYPSTWGYAADQQRKQAREERANWEVERRHGALKDYVEEYKDAAKPVTIQNVKNIVKVVVSE